MTIQAEARTAALEVPRSEVEALWADDAPEVIWNGEPEPGVADVVLEMLRVIREPDVLLTFALANSDRVTAHVVAVGSGLSALLLDDTVGTVTVVPVDRSLVPARIAALVGLGPRRRYEGATAVVTADVASALFDSEPSSRIAAVDSLRRMLPGTEAVDIAVPKDAWLAWELTAVQARDSGTTIGTSFRVVDVAAGLWIADGGSDEAGVRFDSIRSVDVWETLIAMCAVVLLPGAVGS